MNIPHFYHFLDMLGIKDTYNANLVSAPKAFSDGCCPFKHTVGSAPHACEFLT